MPEGSRSIDRPPASTQHRNDHGCPFDHGAFRAGSRDRSQRPYIGQLKGGDVFFFAGRQLEFVRLRDTMAYVKASKRQARTRAGMGRGPDGTLLSPDRAAVGGGGPRCPRSAGHLGAEGSDPAVRATTGSVAAASSRRVSHQELPTPGRAPSLKMAITLKDRSCTRAWLSVAGASHPR